MDESTSHLENSLAQTKFFASETAESKHRAINDLARMSKKGTEIAELKYRPKKKLDQKEEFCLGETLSRAQQKLVELGLPDPQRKLPQRWQLHFFNNHKKIDDVYVSELSTGIAFFVPKGMALSDTKFQYTIYHELAHYVNKTVVKIVPKSESKKGLRAHSFGFNRYTRTSADNEEAIEEGGDLVMRGIYDEPAADLFAMYCIDDDKQTIETNYALQLPFLMCLLKEYAAVKGITALEAFKQLFVAKTQQDFGFQRELAKVFGKRFVRGINNIVVSTVCHSGVKDAALLVALSGEGKFNQSFGALLEDVRRGESFSFPGIKTKAVRTKIPYEF